MAVLDLLLLLLMALAVALVVFGLYRYARWIWGLLRPRARPSQGPSLPPGLASLTSELLEQRRGFLDAFAGGILEPQEPEPVAKSAPAPPPRRRSSLGQ